MDVHKLKIQCENSFNETINIFYSGGDKFKDEYYAVIVKDIPETDI